MWRDVQREGKNIVSGQSLFAADELAYIADHYIYLDHDQRYSLAGGLTYRFGASRLSGDLIYGSGLRTTPAGAPPNSGKLRSYATMNLAFVHSWKESPVGNLEGRVGITNLSTRLTYCATGQVSAWGRHNTGRGGRGSPL